MRKQLNTKKLYFYEDLLKFKNEDLISEDDFSYFTDFCQDKCFKLERLCEGSKLYSIYELSSDLSYKEDTYLYIELKKEV